LRETLIRHGPATLFREASAVFSASVLAACTTLGDDFDLTRAQQVRNGMSQPEVIAIMGSSPSAVEGGGHGKLIWVYSAATPLNVAFKRATFGLDEAGRVSNRTVEGDGVND